jgi:hypothetical protein
MRQFYDTFSNLVKIYLKNKLHIFSILVDLCKTSVELLKKFKNIMKIFYNILYSIFYLFILFIYFF